MLVGGASACDRETSEMDLRLICLIFSLTASLVAEAVQRDACPAAQSAYEEVQASFAGHNYSTVRFVDTSLGNDSEECLSGGESVPCKTVNFAAIEHVSMKSRSNVSSLEIVLLPGEHKLTQNLLLLDSNFVYLHGREAAETFLLCANYPNDKLINGSVVFDDLAFIGGSNLRIANLTLMRCGPISSTIFIRGVTNITIEDCSFQESDGTAVFTINVNNAFFVGNDFLNNGGVRLDDSIQSKLSLRTVQDLQLFFNSRASSAGGVSMSLELEVANVLFLRNTFCSNRARPNFASLPAPMRLQPLGRGGAISLRVINSAGSNVCIKDSTFTNNTAETSAGAITYSVAGLTTNSSLTLDGCTFDGNKCDLEQCIGGAMAFQTGVLKIDDAINYIAILNSVIRNNSAGAGPGFNGFSGRSNVVYHFENCTFEGNMAESDSTAVSILSIGLTDTRGSNFTCTNCNFTANRDTADTNRDVPAFYAYRSTCHFMGETTFSHNDGGGLGLSQAIAFASGTLQFEQNMAVHGAGMKLLNSAELFAFPQTKFLFSNNRALKFGGAIFAHRSRVTQLSLFNLDCFFQYFLPETIEFHPENWDLLVHFQGNTAADSGDAVFSSDFLGCRFLGNTSNSSGLPFEPNIFVPPDGFNSSFAYFHQNGTQIEDALSIRLLLGTEPNNMTTTPKNIEVAIGETTALDVVVRDELLHNTSAVFATEGELKVQSLGTAIVGGIFPVTVGGDQVEANLIHRCQNASVPTPSGGFCSASQNVTVGFAVQVNPLVRSETVLSVVQCHPGYAFDASLEACKCRDLETVDFLRCDHDHRYFYVPSGTWAAMARNGAELVFRSVPTFTLNCTRQASLPGCLVEFDHLERQCAEGRIGPMCAACNETDGFGITMDLKFCTKDCSAGGAILFVLICVATIIGCVVVLYFNIGIPNELRGFFLFAQVIGTVYTFSRFLDSSELGTEFVDILANMLGTSLPFPVCISPRITTTWMTVLGYVPPALALITVLVFIISARYVSRLAKRSALGGMTLISLFVYKYVTDASFLLINCVSVPTEDDSYVWIGRHFGKPCFQLPYLLLVVFALGLFLVAIVPIPISIMIITNKRFRKMKQFSDVLSRGFVPAQGWYSGWDLFRRLCFVLIALWLPFIPVPVRLLILLFFEVVMLVVHCLSKPYEKKWINVVEALILLDLFVATAAILQTRDAYTGKELAVVLVLLPFLYAIPMGTWLLGQAIWSRYISLKRKEQVWAVVGKWYNAFHRRVMGMAGRPPAHGQFYEDSLENSLLQDEAFGLQEIAANKDVTTYREELLGLEMSTNLSTTN